MTTDPSLTPPLRRATLADLPDLGDLDARCVPEDPWGAQGIGAELNRETAILLVIDGPPPTPSPNLPPAPSARPTVAAMILCWQVLDEVEILRVAAHPDARRQGLGRRLVQAALDLPGTRSAFLEVRADNAPAIALYESLGFQKYYVRRRYYHDGCDALMYRRDLPAPA